ncbi:MAG: hypothetical protein D6797_01110 [Bdellovibrio sp.]|nr:MAG: hypothetical protein D6797_01110 [Bdellovibrio sp.]
MISQYIEKASGLHFIQHDDQLVEIQQIVDQKSIQFSKSQVEEVLERFDSQNRPFLQVNFLDNKKILLTEKLIGFKPVPCHSLHIHKLPKVVTTPDLISVIEAIEEHMSDHQNHQQEIALLRYVFEAILEGGEAIGFNLSKEKAWLQGLVSLQHKPSA